MRTRSERIKAAVDMTLEDVRETRDYPDGIELGIFADVAYDHAACDIGDPFEDEDPDLYADITVHIVARWNLGREASDTTIVDTERDWVSAPIIEGQKEAM